MNLIKKLLLSLLPLISTLYTQISYGSEAISFLTLLKAFHEKDMEKFRKLIVDKDDVNTTREFLHLAIVVKPQVVDFLLEAKANVNIPDKDGNYALHVAAIQADTSVVEKLLNAKADINVRTKNGVTLLHGVTGEKLGLLIEAKASVNSADNEGNTALHFAAFYGMNFAVEGLLEVRADVSSLNKEGRAPLLEASLCDNNHTNVVLLLEAKSNIEATDSSGSTALHLATFKGNTEIVRQLLRKSVETTTTPQ